MGAIRALTAANCFQPAAVFVYSSLNFVDLSYLMEVKFDVANDTMSAKNSESFEIAEY